VRFRVEFGWDNQQEIFAYFEADSSVDAEKIAMHLLDRVRITRVVRVRALDEGLARSTNVPRAAIADIEETVDHSRWTRPAQAERTPAVEATPSSPEQNVDQSRWAPAPPSQP
jgi:hypothetical protein